MSSFLFDRDEDEIAPEPTSPGRHRKRRRWLRLLLALLLLAVATGVAGFSYYRWCQGDSGTKDPIAFTIPSGASGGDVVSMLHDRHVIRCGLVSKIVVRSKHQSFLAGTYKLTTNMGLDAALAALRKGPEAPPSLRFTVPPGWRLTQIATRVQDLMGIPQQTFLDEANSGTHTLPPYLPAGTKTLEGFLFPNTYRFPLHGTTSADVITKLLEEFRTEVSGLPWGNASKLGVTDYGVVTIASMIEREARVPQDRAKIAAVIYNRLKIGMALGIDATLLYADPTPGDGTLSNSDLHTDSPYNTRLRTGLPPTPIASPGLASLRAALQPAHVNYLYYVLCGADGHHAFTSSYSEFVRLKAQCLG